MAIPKKRKKKLVPRKAKTGLGGVPHDKGFMVTQNYFHFEVSRKDLIGCLYAYVRTNFVKKDAQAIFANPDYKFFNYTHHAAIAWWLTMGLTKDDKVVYWENALNRYMQELLESGKLLLAEKKAKAKDTDKVVSLSPMQRLQSKIERTIMQDILDLEDQWMDDEKTTLDVYAQFQKHSLPGSATAQVRGILEGWLSDYSDAYNKTCPDAVEGYAHIKRPELNRRIKAIQDMLSDLDRIKNAAKAKRAVRMPKTKAADKQVSRVQYKKEDNEYKLVSIPPIQVIGKHRLYTFDTKGRVIKEFVSTAVNGFQMSGSTLKDFDTVNSRCVRLRRPNDFLPFVLGKTPNQIDKEWKNLTTKTTVPNGRINKDTIILRVMDK